VKAVVQRVASAEVTVEGALVGRIARGVLVFVGVERDDGPDDVEYIARKVCDLRIFEDPDDPRHGFHRSVQDVGGGVLVVSQFTLAGDCRKGRRPSFDAAASPDMAKRLYENVVTAIRSAGLPVATGRFQATMQVALVNDGPVTLLLDSRKRL
jgi:D-tyrosyl-tRNA(Tyr) deacylase